jgi:hypothetical protein
VKTVVEAISHGGEITLRIFPKLKGKVSTGKACFEIAQHGIDPPELGQISGFAATGDDHRMRTPSIGYPVETREAIGQDLTFCIQSTACPAFYGRTGKPLDRSKSRVDGMTLRIDQDRSDKGHFVLGAPSRLAAGVFSSQIGIIGLPFENKVTFSVCGVMAPLCRPRFGAILPTVTPILIPTPHNSFVTPKTTLPELSNFWSPPANLGVTLRELSRDVATSRTAIRHDLS